jgi:GntR family transcriptional repressor for pyruvate dehydrogenase complex
MVRSYQTVLARIEADLAAGRLAVGGRLPAERVLAEDYGVSRASVREAIRVLEAMGLIRTAAGSGPDAGAVLIADPAAPIGAALRWHLTSRSLPVADIVRTRVLIESWSLREAAARQQRVLREAAARQQQSVREATRQPPVGIELAPARALLLEMEDVHLDAGDFLTLDTRFHVALADLAGNTVIAAIMAAMREGIEGYVTAAVDGLPDWPAMAALLRSEHAGILDAVAAGHPELAAELVVAHIEGFYRATGVGQRPTGDPGSGTDKEGQ